MFGDNQISFDEVLSQLRFVPFFRSLSSPAFLLHPLLDSLLERRDSSFLDQAGLESSSQGASNPSKRLRGQQHPCSWRGRGVLRSYAGVNQES